MTGTAMAVLGIVATAGLLVTAGSAKNRAVQIVCALAALFTAAIAVIGFVRLA